jgi:hypothetical protein
MGEENTGPSKTRANVWCMSSLPYKSKCYLRRSRERRESVEGSCQKRSKHKTSSIRDNTENDDTGVHS